MITASATADHASARTRRATPKTLDASATANATYRMRCGSYASANAVRTSVSGTPTRAASAASESRRRAASATTSAPAPRKSTTKARPYDECIGDSINPSGSLLAGPEPSPTAARACASTRSATPAQVTRSGAAKKTITPTSATTPLARKRRRTASTTASTTAAASGTRPHAIEARRPFPSPCDNSRRSTNDRRTRSEIESVPRSAATPPASSPVSTRLTAYQNEPATRPTAPASASDGHRALGWLASAKSARAGSANATVPFVPTARASARAPSASSIRDGPIAK